jgi:hypothetical protein
MDANRRTTLTAQIYRFPTEISDVALSLLKTARALENTAPARCIAIQRKAIALMALEVKQARYAAFAAQKALDALGDT